MEQHKRPIIWIFSCSIHFDVTKHESEIKKQFPGMRIEIFSKIEDSGPVKKLNQKNIKPKPLYNQDLPYLLIFIPQVRLNKIPKMCVLKKLIDSMKEEKIDLTTIAFNGHPNLRIHLEKNGFDHVHGLDAGDGLYKAIKSFAESNAEKVLQAS